MSAPAEIVYLNTILKNIKVRYDTLGTISLSERGSEATLTNVIINGLSSNFFALKPDKSKVNFFSHGYAGRQCDYILLSEYGNEKVAVFVELKSSVADNSAGSEMPQPDDSGEHEDYVKQLMGSCCLFDFLHSVLYNFCNCTVLENSYKRYYVVLHNKDIPPIANAIPPTRVVHNITPQTAYLRKVNNNDILTLKNLIR